MSYLTTRADGTVLLHLHIQPKASRSRIVGLHDGCLKLSIAAPPVDGKANRAVVQFVADFLGVPARDVVVQTGAHSRRKIVGVSHADIARIRRLIFSDIPNVLFCEF